CSGSSSGELPVTVKLRLAVAALLLFLVVMVDFTSRIMSVLADGVLVCGIVVLLWPVIKRNSLHNA
ncbi:DUF3927 family protein, partial [Escherichia coli]|uniref:DUF3927 family protein n=1 Tax=Escherichia coli TaxID=562 RepID=UPI0020193564